MDIISTWLSTNQDKWVLDYITERRVVLTHVFTDKALMT